MLYKSISQVSDLKPTKKLLKRAEKHNLTIECKNGEPQLYVMPGIKNINDSMELDTDNGVVAEISGQIDGLRFEADVRVCGNVRVIFRDKTYKCASQMPKELLKAYHDGADPEEVAKADGKEYETPYYCDENNWFEEYLRIFDTDGKVFAEQYDVVNAPVNDLVVLVEDIINLYEEKKED